MYRIILGIFLSFYVISFYPALSAVYGVKSLLLPLLSGIASLVLIYDGWFFIRESRKNKLSK